MRRKNRLRQHLYGNPGTNFMWHMDSYDKLKPFGICINGTINGFSRMFFWLHAYSTNSDPKVIASYFILIRSDLGTENRYVEQMQKFLR